MRQKVVTIDPNGTSLKSVANFDSSVKVPSVNTSSETIESIMSLRKDILDIGEFTDGNDRSENLFLHDLHLLIDIGEDGGLNEVSFLSVTFTAEGDVGTFVLTGFDVVHDTSELEFRNLRTLDGGSLEWITDFIVLGAFGEFLDEFIVDAFLDVNSRTSTAALTLY